MARACQEGAGWLPCRQSRRVIVQISISPLVRLALRNNNTQEEEAMLNRITSLAAIAVVGTLAWAPSAAVAQTKLQVGARLRGRRALSYRSAVGGRGDQEAHQRQIRDPGLPGLAARQREPDQRGAGARHRRHHLYRRRLRRRDPQAAGDHQRAVRPARLRPLAGLSGQPAVPRARQGLRGQDQHKIVALTYYGQRM